MIFKYITNNDGDVDVNEDNDDISVLLSVYPTFYSRTNLEQACGVDKSYQASGCC